MSAIIVLGAQWGDEGKGKIVDLLASSARAVVRFQGGANAGHTVLTRGRQHVLHLLPSGVLTPGCLNIIAAGCVVDLEQLAEEIAGMQAAGVEVSPDTLVLSPAAHVVTPAHKLLDRLSGAAVGTTGRGIGPAYADKAHRTGIRLESLLDGSFPTRLGERLRTALAGLETRFGHEGAAAATTFDAARALERQVAAAAAVRPFINDASAALGNVLDEGRNVLFEGAQGTLLDIDHGTYPFVTSSNTTIGGALASAGVFVEFTRRVGVLKAYTTRVGNGPFPTELTGPLGDELRQRGAEFGATTGRPRRCGWLDLELFRRAAVANGFNLLALTKMDCLGGISPLRVAVGRTPEREPLYRDLPGWEPADLAACRTFDDLPAACRAYVRFIELETRVPVGLISTGPDRDQCITRSPTW